MWHLFVKLKTSTFFSDRSQFGLSEGSGAQRWHYGFISQFLGLIFKTVTSVEVITQEK